VPDDIHLKWKDEELTEVLKRGSTALNVTFTEQVCVAEGIHQTIPGFSGRIIDVGRSLTTALEEVAEQMQGRFQTFADNFVRGMRRLPEGLEVYRHLLQAATDADDDDLVAGIDSAALLQRIVAHGASDIRASDLT
jgi:hypothetical protein